MEETRRREQLLAEMIQALLELPESAREFVLGYAAGVASARKTA